MHANGKEALEALAQRFPQLYVSPAEGAQDLHRRAAAYGIEPDGATLDHFITTPEDELREVDTPAGPVEVLFLKERADFETFLQIVGHKSSPDPIARTVGAITYLGLADWGRSPRRRRRIVPRAAMTGQRSSHVSPSSPERSEASSS